MAAKTTIKSNAGFAAAIAPVQAALRAWRKERKPRQPIPQALWRATGPLVRAHGLSAVARALGLNYTTLKDHALADSAATPLEVFGQPGFVELPLTPGLVGPATVIELEDRLGSKLTVRLVQGGHAEALTLARELWSARV